MADSNPLVTVVIPTIGRPKYIVDTVRSVLAQDYGHLDVLISDNAPATPTTTVLADQGVNDSRIRIVSRPARMAFSDHMNACIESADGEFMMILSDDDQLSRGYVGEMVTMLASDPTITVGICPQAVVTENNVGPLEATASGTPAQVFEGLTFLQGALAGTLRSNVMTYISLFARRADLMDIGGFRNYPDGSHADNFVLWQLALHGRVALGSNQMLYRVYATSHGLSTPFSALLAATRAYSTDCRTALDNVPTLSAADKSSLLRRLKRNNLGMLCDRLRTVYRKRVAKLVLAGYAVATVKFALTPLQRL
jgi:glycosyltransferase involved in cell wall biosynthesis